MPGERDGARFDGLIRLAEEIATRLQGALVGSLGEVRARIKRLDELVAASEALECQDESVALARECLARLRTLEAEFAWLAPQTEQEDREPAPEVREEGEDAQGAEPKVPTPSPADTATDPSPEGAEGVAASPPLGAEVKSVHTLPGEAVATPRPRKQMTRKRVAAYLSQWLEETKPVPGQTEPDVSTILHWKRLVCEGRMLLAALADHDMDAQMVQDEMRVLRRAFDGLGDDGSFFAFNPSRAMTAGAWEELSRALSAAHASFRAAELLRKSGQLLNGKERSDLVARAMEAAQWAHRVLSEKARVSDMHVNEAVRTCTELATDLSDDRGEPVVTSRKPTGRVAKALSAQVDAWEETIARREAHREAERMVQTAPEAEVVGAIRLARSMGLPASNPTLLDRAATVRTSLSPDVDAEVLRFLQQHEARATAKARGAAATPPPIKPLDPELVRKKTAVRRFCKDKVAVVLGGRTKSQYAEQYRQELGLREVLWPNTDKRTNPSSLEPYADRGDIIIYNPKFSRHAYKNVVDRATQAGKAVVVLNHGYGVEQVTNCMFEQLSRRGYLS